MSHRLDGKTALITGAGSGIGRQVGLRFAAEGARVVFSDRNLEAAMAAAAESSEAIGLQMDVADESSVEAAFSAIKAQSLQLDVVVANAGVQLFGQDAQIADLELDVWQRTIAVNLTGTFLTLKHAVRALLPRGGSIVLTGSPTGVNGEGKDFTAYSSSKAGMHGMARAVAAAYATRSIRVNTVVPGYTETPLVSAISSSATDRASIVSRIPLGRPGRPEDVEGIMVYLASDESTYATGAIFTVDGGMTTL
ncbi:MAG TPA: SDR family NAD(P)-dependent oxidoreductase [Propionibacteriaceae bacterium]|jgi:NAD(P)-dependent dehydrogenase (short-subunit alcohol dehydrogenase family)